MTEEESILHVGPYDGSEVGTVPRRLESTLDGKGHIRKESGSRCNCSARCVVFDVCKTYLTEWTEFYR